MKIHKTLIILLIAIGTFCFGLGSGIWIGIYRPQLFHSIRILYQPLKLMFIKSSSSLYIKISPELNETNIEEIIGINSPDDISRKRSMLTKFIWKMNVFPNRKSFDEMESAIQDPNYSNLQNLKRIDKYTIKMDYGVKSIVYHLFSKRSINRLVIVHSGHDAGFEKDVVSFFINNNYDVIALSMPLYGMNNQPSVSFARFGKFKFRNHDQFKFLDSIDFSSIRFFIEPVAITINYIKYNYDYESISMVGLSGGGWTTTLYAALDPRVSKSYPVAGSYPLFMREDDFGDYEQTLPELYTIANYLELYIMGSYGESRKQLQILNQYDSCCMYGIRYQLYLDNVKRRLKLLGKGSFDVYLDSTHESHIISRSAMQRILIDMGK